MSYDRVLVVAAHPDDPEYLFGATIARLAAEGAELHYLICSDGSLGSRDASISSDALAAVRCAEQRAAAESLGVSDVVFLGLPDGRLSTIPADDLQRGIVR